MLHTHPSRTGRRPGNRLSDSRFIDRRGIARELGVSMRTVDRLVRSEGFPKPFVINTKPLWVHDEFEQWLASQRHSLRRQ
jgi:predicted DNA-binding transcriptional regulator AlpA